MKFRIALALMVIVLLGGGGIYFWLTSQQRGEIVLQQINGRTITSLPGLVYVFAAFTNTSGPDWLESVQSKDALDAELFNPAGRVPIPIPAGSTPSLAADGAYIRLHGVQGELEVGRLIPVTLKFANGGKVTANVKVGTPLDYRSGGESGEYGVGKTLAVPEGATIPRIELRAEKIDAGWRVHISKKNFEFSHQVGVVEDHSFGMGHAHLYLSGLKLARVFEDTVDIGELAPGNYEIRVTLVSADHRALMVGDELVTGVTNIIVE